jgi:hypothetical protein
LPFRKKWTVKARSALAMLFLPQTFLRAPLTFVSGPSTILYELSGKQIRSRVGHTVDQWVRLVRDVEMLTYIPMTGNHR